MALPRYPAGIVRTAVLAVVIGLAGCAQQPPQRAQHETMQAGPGSGLDALLQDFVAGHYQRMPTAAVNSGLHAYDGQLPDFSPEGIRERVAWLERMHARAAAMDSSGLGTRERLYLGYLAVEIDTQLFNIQVLRQLENNAWYDYLALDPNIYLSRDYALLAVRMDAYTRHVEGLPRAMAAMKRTLKPMPSGHAEAMSSYLEGLATFVISVPYEVFGSVSDAARQERMQRANDRAAAALTALVQWLAVMPRDESFALGPERYAALLWSLERIDTPVGELKAILEKDFERNLQSLERACAAFAPGATPADCRARVAARKSPDGPVAAATRQVARLKQLMLERKLATIPPDLQVRVEESPPQWRSSSPYIAVPGPLERNLPSVYYLSSPDPAWTPEHQQQFLLSEADLMSVTTHCVWSGHILEAMRSNLSGNPLAVFTYSYAYTEGWSHYSEEMMLHEALDDDPEMAIGQLQNALMNDTRALASIAVHTEGMSLAEAERMFRERAFSDPESARLEAVRASFDPGNVLYALGKLMVMKLRDDWLALHPGRSLGEFHDAFLSYGNPPLRLLREAMLGTADDGRLF